MGCGGSRTVVQPVRVSPQHNEKYEGPIRDRQCRDVLALIIFLGFLLVLAYVIHYSVDKGNPKLLFYGTDSWGNVCNQKNDAIDGVNSSGRDTRGHKKLFFFNEDLLEKISTESTPTTTSGSVCISECPAEVADVAAMQAFATNSGSRLCRYDVQVANYYDGAQDGTSTCPSVPISKTKSVHNRCVSEGLSDTLDRVGEALSDLLDMIDDNFGQKCGEDLEDSWKEIIYLILISIGVSLALMLLLRFIAPIIVWLVVAIVVVGAILSIAFCWYSYFKKETKFWLGTAIAVSVVGVILLLILLVMRKRIALVVQLFKEAGRAVARMPQLILQPFITLIILGGVSAALVYVFLFIVTARNHHVEITDYVSWTDDEPIKGMVVIYLLGFLWLTQFIIGCERLTVSSSVALWYFTRDKSKLSSPVSTSVWRLIRYHLGSVAFGSLIIALVALVRIILSFIEGRLSGSKNKVAKVILKCITCCLWCFEQFLKFLTANAYIQIAINGYAFCKAARTAFMVVVSNALRVAAINSVGDFVLFLAKVGTVAIVAVVGIEIFRDKELHYIWLPILLACIAAYFVAGCFFGLYELIIDAIFMCFVEDCEKNDGVQQPYFMSTGLMQFVKNADQALKADKKRKERDQNNVTTLGDARDDVGV
ncbi:choline transporter-like protein 1 [Plakobranchus ocellatus]|uniref:Choline transporter-like protein n=1 Tax=Plakobranchus ocellatus TaxID=259542 RepID=A0AAV3ZNP7_9GAST|nr:choline transporter-like protein 1 [Plakobranchus ocellatus]